MEKRLAKEERIRRIAREEAIRQNLKAKRLEAKSRRRKEQMDVIHNIAEQRIKKTL